jgi:signal transduction histidine kinase
MLERWGDTKVMSESLAAHSMQPAPMEHLMEVAAGSYAPNYELLLVADTDGRIIAAYDPAGSHPEPAQSYIGRNVSAAPWFKGALRSNTVVVTESKSPALPELGRGSEHHQVMGFANAIRDRRGVAIGVWINFVSWSIVENIIDQSVVESHSRQLDLVLLNNAGRAIASNQTPSVIAPLATGDPTAERTVTAIRTGHVIEVPADALFKGETGREFVATYHSHGKPPYPGLGWMVLATQDTRATLAPAMALRKRFVILGLIAVGFIGLAIAATLTALKRAVSREESLQQSLRQSYKLEAVGRLTSGIAHDFNNLLTVIGGNAHLARRGATEERDQRRLDEIIKAGDQATDLVRRLLSFSRASVGKKELTDLNLHVTETTGMLSRLFHGRVLLKTELASEPAVIELDPVEIDEILLNLAFNARDAMPDGGDLTFRTALTDHQVILTVSDTGVGIDEHVRERIFDPFFTTKSTGTGLGLATVYGIATEAGGTIDVHSELGIGTTFAVTLPRKQVTPAPGTV